MSRSLKSIFLIVSSSGCL